MCNGGFLRACCHFKRAEKNRDHSWYLLDIFLFTLYHSKDNTVTLPHTFGMIRTNILVNNLFPASTTQPSTKKALDLWTNTSNSWLHTPNYVSVFSVNIPASLHEAIFLASDKAYYEKKIRTLNSPYQDTILVYN